MQSDVFVRILLPSRLRHDSTYSAHRLDVGGSKLPSRMRRGPCSPAKCAVLGGGVHYESQHIYASQFSREIVEELRLCNRHLYESMSQR